MAASEGVIIGTCAIILQEQWVDELSSPSEIIERMQANLKPWVILQVEPLREVMQHFNPEYTRGIG